MDRNFTSFSIEHLLYLSLLVLVGTPVVYLLYSIIHSLYFHLLAKYPGPWYCRVSRLPWVSCVFTSIFVQRKANIVSLTGLLAAVRTPAVPHQACTSPIWRHIVRLAPDELSFATPEAWQDIFGYNKGKQQWPRHP